MPVKIPSSLPAVEILKAENIFVMDDLRASTQDIRPLKLLILNLMPLKIVTETDLLRLISNTPLQIELDFMSVSGHISRNTPLEHIDTFYKDFDEIRGQNYDGMIITGAPVEKLQFEEVDYWNELVEIFDWAHKHVTSTLYICWAALAGLYHFYGIPKYPLDKKLFGVFAHHKYDERNPIFRGFDDLFYVPHSRYSEVRRADIEKDKSLTILSESRMREFIWSWLVAAESFSSRGTPNIRLSRSTSSIAVIWRKASTLPFPEITIPTTIPITIRSSTGEDMPTCFSRIG